MKDTVAILLSTYNSEKYICEQINSILSQTYKQWKLFIRDDGSIDGTISIIQNYCNKHSNIIFFESKEKNLGTRDSFLGLLKNTQGKYYMFCDHDDVWLPFKIEITYKEMKKAEQNNFDKPIIVNTDLIVVDDKLQTIHSSMWKYSGFLPDVLKSSFYYLSVCNFVNGCTMMINQKAKEISFPVSSNATLHDNWIALKVITSGGIIVPINMPTILYRQHKNNVCGATIFGKNYIFSKFQDLSKLYRINKIAYRMSASAGKINIFMYCIYKVKYYIKRKSIHLIGYN